MRRPSPSADVLSPKMKEAAGAHQGPATSDMVSGRSVPTRETMRAAVLMAGERCLEENTSRLLRTEDFRPRLQLSGASPERTEPTPLLNHETSDHLLSLVETMRLRCRIANVSQDAARYKP